MYNRYHKFNSVFYSWSTILLLGAIGMLLGILLSLLRPLEYSSTVRILITQELGTVDAYSASLSVERIADDLSNIIYTTSFFDKVIALGSSIDQSYFPDNDIKRRKKWNRMIISSVSRSSGLLTIRAYHTNVEQAEDIAMTVANVLIQKGWTYTSGSNITVQLVDEPLNSRFPVRPNILVNGFSGFILGILAAISYILIQTEKLKRRHQLIHEE